jgi:hypothetical protein
MDLMMMMMNCHRCQSQMSWNRLLALGVAAVEFSSSGPFQVDRQERQAETQDSFDVPRALLDR